VINLAKGFRLIITGIIINAALAIIKISTGIIGHSYALIADGIESTVDIFSSLVVYSGIKIGSLPPDKNHPYGHGKAESLSAMVVSIFLLGAAVYIIIHSIHEIVTPHLTPAPYTLFVLIGVIITKEFLYRSVFKEGDKVDSTAMKTDAWHHRSDALTSLAAGIGITISLIAGPGYESADDWGALLASGVIIYNGIRMFMNAISEIMDESAPAELENKIKETIMSVKGVLSINQIKIRKGGISYLVDANITVDGEISIYKGHDIATEVETKLFNSDLSISNVMVHVEPKGVK
jgi:cation diffusion facilitator family transporter